METFDKVVKAAEKLNTLSNETFGSWHAFTPLAVLWAGYTVAEAIKEAARPTEGEPHGKCNGALES